jgi:hypothetical protein
MRTHDEHVDHHLHHYAIESIDQRPILRCCRVASAAGDFYAAAGVWVCGAREVATVVGDSGRRARDVVGVDHIVADASPIAVAKPNRQQQEKQ